MLPASPFMYWESCLHLEGRKAPWDPDNHGGFLLGQSEYNYSFRIQSYNCFKIIPLGPNTGSNGMFLLVTLSSYETQGISTVALGLLPLRCRSPLSLRISLAP